MIRGMRIEGAHFHLAPTMASIVLACACVSGAAIPASSSAHLLAGCTAAFGVAQVERLLNVLGGGHSPHIRNVLLTPAVRPARLKINPSTTYRLVHHGVDSSS